VARRAQVAAMRAARARLDRMSRTGLVAPAARRVRHARRARNAIRLRVNACATRRPVPMVAAPPRDSAKRTPPSRTPPAAQGAPLVRRAHPARTATRRAASALAAQLRAGAAAAARGPASLPVRNPAPSAETGGRRAALALEARIAKGGDASEQTDRARRRSQQANVSNARLECLPRVHVRFTSFKIDELRASRA
jgi:hypothetical protein